ncbi:MAG: D-alanyl-D-alanine carboxypeptidase family protein [Kiritimatiellales bacterium]
MTTFSKPWKFLIAIFPIIGTLFCAQALDIRSRDPYYGAVVIDADTGAILKEDHAAAQGYPASMVKLANLFIVLDDLKAGKLSLTEPIQVSREVALIGERQVWLKQGEVFPLEELIYAMMIHSANDAAAALAIRDSATREAHAARMTAKARELGLKNTVFHNVHGLPPSAGQEPDMTSALDMALLARALIHEHPETLHYSSISTREFREGDQMVLLTSSNKLLGKVPGCDGLKTGYFYAGGFSITATAERDGRRVIAVILGCKDKTVRDAKAAEWIEAGFSLLPPVVEEPVVSDEPSAVVGTPEPASVEESTEKSQRDWLMPVLIGLPVVIAVVIAIVTTLRRRPH